MVDERRTTEGDAPREVVVAGRLRGDPRAVRTAEGWEVAAFVIDADPGSRHGDGVLATCTGPGAAVLARRLRAGDSVIAVGEVRRTTAHPDDATPELEVRALLARTPPPDRLPRGGRPRISA